jgi:V/A-type H+/Na+-transporting ATPase subunit D
MARLKISPTRSNLLMVRQRLSLAREGHDLLNRKRDVLMSEILRTIDDAQAVQNEVDAQFAKAYEMLQEAKAVMGTERVRRAALMQDEELGIQVTPRSVMGVVVPSIRSENVERQPTYGFGDTSVLLDQARMEWAQALSMLGRLSEMVTSVSRMAFELRKTQRRVNALEEVHIPSYEDTLKYIEETLEEKDREELSQLKQTRDDLRRSGGPSGTGRQDH